MRKLFQKECLRCGTCCKKGGPAFHLEDKALVENGLIPAKTLYTIRKGEMVHDPARGLLLPLDSEMIKIKGQGRSSALSCVFLGETESTCMIYDDRPVECRALKCWDTVDIEAVYLKNLLTREDVLSENSEIWSLVEEHEKICSYERLANHIKTLKETRDHIVREEVSQIIEFDRHLRILVAEKKKIDSEILDFLFGRPLSITTQNRFFG